MMDMEQLVFATTPGLEAVAAREIEELFGVTAAPRQPGRLFADSGAIANLVPSMNYRLRCVDRLGIVVARAEAVDLEQIRAIAARVKWGDILHPDRTLAVRGYREGTHAFRSVEVASVVGSAVIDGFSASRGRRLAVDLDDPDVVVRAELFDDRLVLWIDTTGDIGLHRRAYRRYAHMASMRPTVANLLVRLSGWRDELLLDPFCGSATLLIEAGHLAVRTAPGELRGTGWAWQRLPGFGFEAVPRDAEEGFRRRLNTAPLVGIERFARHLRGAVENIGRAGMGDVVQVRSGLAELSDEVLAGEAPGTPRIVVTNPPFGRRVSSTGRVAQLYIDAAAAWQRAGVTRVVAVAELGEAMGGALNDAGYQIAQMLPVIYGRTPVRVLVATC